MRLPLRPTGHLGRVPWPATRRGEDLVALCIIVCVTVLVLLTALDGSGTFSATGKLYELLPWSPFPVEGASRNPLLSDPAVDFWPWFDYARERLRAGDLPGWNPYVLSGTPFLANAQTAIFSPFNVPLWVLPFGLAFGVSAALKVITAAFGTYLLARRLGCSMMPGLVAAASFAGCSYLVVWLSHPHVNVLVVIPWLLLAAERARARPWLSSIALVGLALAVMMLGGHPGTQVHGAVALVVWVAARQLAEPAPRFGRVIVVIASGCVVGALAAAVAWLPPAFLVPGSSGLSSREGSEVLEPSTLVTLLFPDWWSSPISVNYLGGPSNYNERTVFAGGIALVLALAAAAGRPRRSAAPAALVVFGLAGAYGLWPVGWVNGHLPPLSLVAGQRVMLLAQLGVAVLAGVGTERLLCNRRRVDAVFVAAVLGVLVAAVVGLVVVLYGPQGAGVSEALSAIRARAPTPQFIHLTALGPFVYLAAALAALALMRRRLAPRLLGALVLASVLFEALTFARGYQPIMAPAAAFPKAPPALEALQRAHPTRMTAISDAFTLLPDSAMPYRLRDMRGHDPPEPDADYSALLTSAGSDATGVAFSRFTPHTARVLELLAVQDVLVDPGKQGAAPAGWKQLYAGADGVVLRDEAARPRAFVPGELRRARGTTAIRALMLAPDMVPRTQAVVDETARARAGDGMASEVTDHGDSVEVHASMRRAGLLVLADRFAPGWRVSVDGRPARQVRVDTVLRGVEVPAGQHAVRWQYTVPGLRASLVGSAIGALLIATLLGFGAVRRLADGRRRRASDRQDGDGPVGRLSSRAGDPPDGGPSGRPGPPTEQGGAEPGR